MPKKAVPNTAMHARLLAALGLVLLPALAMAQAWPSKPIHFVTLFVPGSTGDLTCRIIAQGMAKSLGQPVIVDNLAGGGGVVAGEKVARAEIGRAHV